MERKSRVRRSHSAQLRNLSKKGGHFSDLVRRFTGSSRKTFHLSINQSKLIRIRNFVFLESLRVRLSNRGAPYEY
jgi:hypothetical protein